MGRIGYVVGLKGDLVRLLLTAMRCVKGDLDGNARRHLDLLAAGRAAGCDLVLLPEMSLTGYDPEAAVRLTHDVVTALVAATQDGPRLSFGLAEAASPGEDADGRPTITQVLADGGAVLAVHRKSALPPDERATFRAGSGWQTVAVNGTAVVTAVCAEIGSEKPYRLEADLVWRHRLQGFMVPGASARRTGDAASTGGVAVFVLMPSGCSVMEATWRCRLKPVRPSTRTSPAGRLWSVLAV